MNIEPIKLLKGSHANTGSTGQGCVMNVIAYLNGEDQITDQSRCVCYTARPLMIYYNDFATDEQRQRMVPFIMRAMGSATDDKTEISRRLKLLVEFANWQADSAAKYAVYAAKYAVYAEYAAKYAAYAAKSAAEYAAKYAAYAAKSAAEYAAKSAEYAAYQQASFDRGMKLLDDLLPPMREADSIVLERSQMLIALSNKTREAIAA